MTDPPSPRKPADAAELLDSLRRDSKTCVACPLWRDATQTVFGEGDANARVILIGEQPGDAEDREGRPFVGPAGRLLDRALVEAGLDRTTVYVTNAVKHFKWTPRGKRRLHKTPAQREIDACRIWLDGEMAALAPDLIVCLGATAARAILGPDARIGELRGRILERDNEAAVLVTVHPSYVLRVPEADRQAAFDAFVRDLAVAVQQLPKR